MGGRRYRPSELTDEHDAGFSMFVSPISAGDYEPTVILRDHDASPCDYCNSGFRFDSAAMEGVHQVDVIGQWTHGGCAIESVPWSRWPSGFKSKPPPSGKKRGRIRDFPTCNGN